MTKILLLVAVWQEADNLLRKLGEKWNHKNAYIEYQQKQICIQVTGVGAVNAALTATQNLTQDPHIDQVWMMGCCGSYHNDILIGDIIISTCEINGDLGIMSNNDWQSPKKFPFSILEKNGKHFYQDFPCKTPAIPTTKNNYQIHYGNMLTTSIVSGCQQHAQILAKRHAALAENMEGAAVAHVAAFFNKPFTEIRGVSNRAGDRNKTNWDFSTAFTNNSDLCLQIWQGDV